MSEDYVVIHLVHGDLYSGAEKVLADLISQTDENKHIVCVSPNNKLHSVVSAMPNASVLTLKDNGNVTSYDNKVSLVKSIIKSNWEVGKSIRKSLPVVIHANGYLAAVKIAPVILVCRFLGVGTYWTLHDIRQGSRKWLHYVISRVTNKTVSVSNAVRQSMIRASNARNIVIRNAISKIPVAFQGEDGGAPKILLIGLLARWKGYDRVINEWSRMELSGVEMHLIGDGADRMYRSELLAISSELKYHGYQQDPWSVTGGNRVLLHSAVMPDPFPTVVIEAISRGVIPVVSFNSGAVEIIPRLYKDLLTYDPVSSPATGVEKAALILGMPKIEREAILRELMRCLARKASVKTRIALYKKLWKGLA